METLLPLAPVIPVLVTGAQPSANVDMCGDVDPGNTCRGDQYAMTAVSKQI